MDNYSEGNTDQIKNAKIILACGGVFVGAFIMARSHDHAYDSLIADTRDSAQRLNDRGWTAQLPSNPLKRNIAIRAFKQMRKIIFGILK